MVKTDTCASCGQTFPITQLRYIKVNSEWFYMCTPCRRKHQTKGDET